jgi:hypothetical protein
LFLEALQPCHRHGSLITQQSSRPRWGNFTTPSTSDVRGLPIKRCASHRPTANILTQHYPVGMSHSMGGVVHASIAKKNTRNGTRSTTPPQGSAEEDQALLAELESIKSKAIDAKTPYLYMPHVKTCPPLAKIFYFFFTIWTKGDTHFISHLKMMRNVVNFFYFLTTLYFD